MWPTDLPLSLSGDIRCYCNVSRHQDMKNIQSTDTNSTVETPTVETPTVKVDFGAGRYSTMAKELWQDSMHYFGFSSEVAEKFARNATSEIGRLVADGTGSVKIGKGTAKTGLCTLRDTTIIKGVGMTANLRCARLIQCLNELTAEGMVYAETSVGLHPNIVGVLHKA